MERRPDIGILGAIGATLLILGTALHPGSADPNDPAAAFAEYAATSSWLTSHLLQLAGAVMLLFALLRIAQELRAPGTARLAEASASATIALTAVLQAVDGIALKAAVDNWAAAAEPARASAFQAALAVRQVEVGLAAVSSMSIGVTAALLAIATLRAGAGPRALGLAGLCGGALSVVAGLLLATSGFSATAMNASMLASLVLLAWVLGHGWRHLGAGRGRPANI